MAKVFVSYSRKDIEFARRLTAELQKCDLDFWIDWEDIAPTMDWWKEIEKGIEEADIFLFLISPDSAKSVVCGQEIDAAVKNAKRMIPLVVRDIAGDEAPKQLSHLNWIFFRPGDDFDAAFQKLKTAVYTDYEWVQQHRWLQVRALDWERDKKDQSSLLRGKDLQDAEYQLATNTSKEPHPTDLQREFVFASRKAMDRQRQYIAGISIAGLIALAALTFYGFLQAGLAKDNARDAQAASTEAFTNLQTAETAKANAENQRATAVANEKIALARQFAAQAISNLENDPERSILLALQAISTTYDTREKMVVPEAEDALHQAIQASHIRLTLIGHTGRVNGIAYSPNGKYIASTSSDATAKIWDATTGMELLTLNTGRVPPGNVTNIGISFSPDTKRLATASSDNTAKIWDVGTAKELLSLKGHVAEITGIAFSPDGTRIATGSANAAIKVWDAYTGQEILSMNGQGGSVYAIVFSQDGTQLASTNQFFTTTIWDATSGKMLLDLTGHHANVFGVNFSPDGKRIVSASLDGTAKIWDVITGKELLTLQGHDGSVNNAIFSPDGRTVATASSDKTAMIWDMLTGKRLFTLNGHTGAINSITFSPDGMHLVTASDDTSIKVWNTIANQELMTMSGNIGETTGNLRPPPTVVFSLDGTRLAASNQDGVVKIWSATSGREILTLPKSDLPVNDVAFNPNGELLATGDWNNTATIWDLTTGKRLRVINACNCQLQGGVIHVAFSPDGMKLVTTSVDDSIKIWSVNSGIELLALEGSWYSNAVFSPDGAYIANSNKIWNSITGQYVVTLQGQTSLIRQLAFSPTGNLLATASPDESAKLWDVKTGELLRTFEEQGGGFREISFYHNGQLLITQSDDHIIRIWNTTSGEELQSFRGQTINFVSFALNPSETRLAIAGSDGTIGIYILPTQDLIQLGRSRLTRTWTQEECKRYLQMDTCLKTP